VERENKLCSAMEAWCEGGAYRASEIRQVKSEWVRLVENAPIGDDDPLIHPLVVPYFACFLKLGILWREAQGRYRATQRIELFENFGTWMNEDAGAILAYAMQIARDRFIGPQNNESVEYLDKLMKFGSANPIKAFWSAAWDVTLLSQLDAQYGPSDVLGTGGRPTFLVTADKGLMGLRSRLQHRVTIPFGDGRLVQLEGDGKLDSRVQPNSKRISLFEEKTRDVVVRRAHEFGRDPNLAALDRLVENLVLGFSRP
jgi:hypothetical protein